MAIRVNPEADRRAGELRRRGRPELLPLRQLLGGVPPLRRALRLSPQVRCAYLQMGLEEKLMRGPRAVALLLLRPVLDAVPARRRARRDHDEPAPLADLALRLHRHLARCSTAPGRPSSRPCFWWRLLTGVGFLPTGFLPGGDIRLLRRRPGVPAELARPRLRLGHGRRALASCCSSTPSACGGSRSGRNKRPARAGLASYVKALYLLPLHFFTQKRYAKCENEAAVGHPPGADAQLRDHAGPDHVLPGTMQAGPDDRLAVHAFGYVASVGLLRDVDLRAARPAQEDRAALHALPRVGLDLPDHAPRRGRHRRRAARPAPHRPRAAANITYVVHLMGWSRCSCSRCPSASGRTWPTGRWPCTSRRSPRRARGHAAPPRPRAARSRPAALLTRDEVSYGRSTGSASIVCNCGTNIAKVVDCETSCETAAEHARRGGAPAPTSTCAPTPARR